jgi:hypothetical protein
MARAAPGISSRRLWRIGLPVSSVSSSASSSRGFHQVGERIEHRFALRRRGLRPVAAIKDRARGLHRAIDVGLFAAGDVRQRLLGGGSTVSNVVLSAAAQYSPLINNRVSMALFFAFSCQ